MLQVILSAQAGGCLNRICERTGQSKREVVEQALIELENQWVKKTMNKLELSALLKETTHLVNVYLGEEKELISSGSAVSINEKGLLITAAHVVTGRLPIRTEDVNDPEVTIYAGPVGRPLREYKPNTCGISLDAPYTKSPLCIDLALLTPKEKLSGVKHLKVISRKHEAGVDVLMAGFPDDLELPLSFDRHLDMNQPENKGLDAKLEIFKRLLMIKRGMVGHSWYINMNGGPNQDNGAGGETMYIDNVMHSGSSGGPVIDYDGNLIGIITQRAITSVPYEDTPNLKVPSGSTLAISPEFILSAIGLKKHLDYYT